MLHEIPKFIMDGLTIAHRKTEYNRKQHEQFDFKFLSSEFTNIERIIVSFFLAGYLCILFMSVFVTR